MYKNYCEMFSRFRVPKIIKIGSFLPELYKKIMEGWRFWKHGVVRRVSGQ